MPGRETSSIPGLWPSAGVLLLCAALLAAGYCVALLQGPSAAVPVGVRMVPAAEVPAEP